METKFQEPVTIGSMLIGKTERQLDNLGEQVAEQVKRVVDTWTKAWSKDSECKLEITISIRKPV